MQCGVAPCVERYALLFDNDCNPSHRVRNLQLKIWACPVASADAHRAIMAASQSPRLTLAEELLLAVGEGRVSLATAARLSLARVAEGGADHNCETLAGCGDKNGERKLHRWCKGQPWRQLLPEPYGFEAPIRKLGAAATGSLYCLLPHLVFARLAERAMPIFAQLFGTEAERRDFWDELQRTGREVPAGTRGDEHRSWLRSHPVLKSTPAQLCVPVGLHGDGGAMTSGEKVMVISWGAGGICNPGPTLDTRVLFCVVKESTADAEGHATLYAAFNVLQWSMEAMAANLHPAKDHAGRAFGPGHWPAMAKLAGTPLVPEGLRGAWLELRGDWQFLRAALNLQQHYNAPFCCHLCAVTKQGRGHYGAHLARGSPMRHALVTSRSWKSNEPRSPLTKIPGFNIWRCSFDAMHTLELGLLQRIIPAALRELAGVATHLRARGIFGDGNVAKRCERATRAYHQWATATKVSSSARVKAITAAWIKKLKPQLSQSHAKAAALRAMLPWVAKLCEEQRAASPRRADLMTELLAMDRVWTQAPRFMSLAQVDAAALHCERAVTALAALVAEQPAEGPWHLIPKVHALTHLAYDGAMGNPRASHCYQDEDFVGRAKRIYVRCHGRTAPLRAAQRYAMHAALRLTARLELLRGVRLHVGAPVPAAAAQSSAGNAAPGGAERPPARRGRGRPKREARPEQSRGRGRPKRHRA